MVVKESLFRVLRQSIHTGISIVGSIQQTLGRIPIVEHFVVVPLRKNWGRRQKPPNVFIQDELEPGRWIVKINPMAAWSRQQVWGYLKEHDLPHNPLYDLGYSSIGCAPCTRARLPDEPERAGRWAGLSKWECGIQATPVDQATTQSASGAS